MRTRLHRNEIRQTTFNEVKTKGSETMRLLDVCVCACVCAQLHVVSTLMFGRDTDLLF